MSNTQWLNFWPQCSDALDYLDKGKKCAESGLCFDTLRPMVSNLWFSMPVRLGLPAESLLLMHAALFFASVMLASYVLLVLAKKMSEPTLFHKSLIVIVCTAVHAIFLRPTIFYALTDTPAALLVLIAFEWLLLIQIKDFRYAPLAYAAIGLLLGLAIGLRVFYLYPVVITVVAFLLLSFLMKKNGGDQRYKQIYVCVMFVPVLMQMHATYLYSGNIAYLPQGGTQYWRNTHQHSPYIGYDTLIPEQPYPWYGDKTVCMGLWPAVEQRNWRGLQCTLSGRLSFLLGSYAHQTYVQSNRIDWDYMFTDPRLQMVELSQTEWPFERTLGGGRVSFSDGLAETPWKMLEEIWLDEATPLTFSVTLRDATAGDKPHSLFFWLTEENGHVIDQHELILSRDLHRYHWKTAVTKAGRYAAVIGSPGGNSAPALFDAGDFTVQTGWHEEPYPMAPERLRMWSTEMLAIQCLTVLVLLVVMLKKCRTMPGALVLALLPLLILAQSLLVIPEQRFIVVMEIVLWLSVVGVIQNAIQKTITMNKQLLKSTEN